MKKKNKFLVGKKISVNPLIFFGEIPLMTEEGSFFVNGCERIVVSQMIRSPGVYFQKEFHSNNRAIYTATIISNKGIWSKIVLDSYLYKASKKEQKKADTNRKSWERVYLVSNDNRKRKQESYSTEEQETEARDDDSNFLYLPELLHCFGLNLGEVLDQLKYPFLASNQLLTPHSKKRSKPERKKFFANKVNDLFNPSFQIQAEAFSIGEIGRYRMNRQLNLNLPEDITHITALDLLGILNGLLELKYANRLNDDIDHMKNKQIRPVGDLLQNQFRVGLSRLDRWISDYGGKCKAPRLSTIFPNPEEPLLSEALVQQIPRSFFDSRQITTAFKEFFLSSQLAQYMDQTNPLAELTQRRRVTVFGPNGLQRDHVSTVIRDLHPSQYGRLCPIETPEGQNAGLVTSLSLYSRFCLTGWLEAPYFLAREKKIDASVQALYLTPDQEAEASIAFGDFALSSVAQKNKDSENLFPSQREILPAFVSIKKDYSFGLEKAEEKFFVTPSPLQLISAATSLVPFLEHDDGNRALMGANMQRQAVPLLLSQKPIVGTGFEVQTLLDSQFVIKAYHEGIVKAADSAWIVIQDQQAQQISYKLQKYRRSNQSTCINQRPLVWKNESIFSNQILADGASSLDGELALGRNLTIAYMPWEGYNYEDAIVISERVVIDDCLTSVHFEEYETTIDYFASGLEVITREIPTISAHVRRHLSKNGVVKLGSYVKGNDVLVGKAVLVPHVEHGFSPLFRFYKTLTERGEIYIKQGKKLEKKGETKTAKELTNKGIDLETKGKTGKANLEKGLKKSQNQTRYQTYRDNSLRVPIDMEGRVVDIRLFATDGEETQFLNLESLGKVPSDVLRYKQSLKITIAQIRKIQIGDKLAGRHGNKGIISRILPRQDMPYLPDGKPVDILFNPLGVPSRMNVGQIYECLLGLAGQYLDRRFKVTPFDEMYGKEASRVLITQKLKEAALKSKISWLSHPLVPGKIYLRDGRTGDLFENPVLVGKAYILKLIHLVEDKIHARATGPYAMITEQPLGGKAQNGGQRFGEMEVWALEAFGCSHILQELLTIKSDDMDGRVDIYESITFRRKWWAPQNRNPSVPEGFLLIIRELNALGLDVSVQTSQAFHQASPLDKKSKVSQEKKVAKSIGTMLEHDLFSEMEKRLQLRNLKNQHKAEKLALVDNLSDDAKKFFIALLQAQSKEIVKTYEKLLKVNQEYILTRELEDTN